MAEYITT